MNSQSKYKSLRVFYQNHPHEDIILGEKKWEKPESNYIDCLQSYDYPLTLFKYFVNIKVRFKMTKF